MKPKKLKSNRSLLILNIIAVFLLSQFLTGCYVSESDFEDQNTEALEEENSKTNDLLTTETKEAGAMFVPNYPANSKQRRNVSLKKLVSEAIENPDNEDVLKLYGLGWIEGYVIDKENNDIILFGRENEDWPNLTLDDLIVNIENVLNNEPYPYCSLDPIPENVLEFDREIEKLNSSIPYEDYYKKLDELWGGQEVVVGGVPPKSHHALVMLDADYHMKKVSQGHVTIQPIVSILDLSFNESLKELFSDIDNSTEEPTSNMSRFWFNMKQGNPLFQYAEGIVMIDSCEVVLLTEAQRSAVDGTLYDSGDENPRAEKFAKQFTLYFKKAATEVKDYSQLENLFRLQAILRAMKFKGHLNEFAELFNKLINNYPYRINYDIPNHYPGLVNVKKVEYGYSKDGYIGSRIILNQVNGGVSMELSILTSSFKQLKIEQITIISRRVIEENSSNEISWTSEL